MSDKYIDQTGLARILTNLKANFATKTELQNAGGGSVSYMSDQEVIDILNDDEEAWTGLEKVKTLWENASPSSGFAAQTVTLSESMANFDLIILYCFNYKVETTPEATALSLATVMRYGLAPNQYMNFSRLGGGTDSVFRIATLASETTVAFSVCTKNTSTDNAYLIPYAILGINL